MNKISFLFRIWNEDEEEFNIASEYLDFPVFRFRSEIPNDQKVIGRYSVLPFRKELGEELELKNSHLINSYSQHKYIADFEYYEDIKDYTPETWFQWYDLPEGEYIVKGKTNSRKFQWKHQMFASSKEEVPNIVSRLMDDSLVRDQGVIVRKFEKLTTYLEGMNGLPVTNEWRFFLYKDKIIDWGYYWADEPDCQPYESPPHECFQLVHKVKHIVKEKTNFYVIDVGEKQDGTWTVIELNSGEMSGLSLIEPRRFYHNFNKILKEEQNGKI